MDSLERNEWDDGEFILSPTDDFSVFSEFDCDDKDLNDFIQNEAKNHKEELLVETYSFRNWLPDKTKSIPVAFISLCNDSIKLNDVQKQELLPKEKRGYRSYPAVKIARLGVRVDFQGMGIGSRLINNVKHFFLTKNRTGCRFITVDAYSNEKALRFYQGNDFNILKEPKKNKPSPDTLPLYFDLKRFQETNSWMSK